MLVLLFDLDRIENPESEKDDWDDAEDARRCRRICVGSTPGTFATRANNDKTSSWLANWSEFLDSAQLTINC